MQIADSAKKGGTHISLDGSGGTVFLYALVSLKDKKNTTLYYDKIYIFRSKELSCICTLGQVLSVLSSVCLVYIMYSAMSMFSLIE